MQLGDTAPRSDISDPIPGFCFAKRPTVFELASLDEVEPVIFVRKLDRSEETYLFLDYLLPEALHFGLVVLAGTVNNG